MNEQAQPIQAVPLLDLKRQFAEIREPVMAALASVCESQRFVLGTEVAAFEREMADYCGVAFGVGVSSGTDALLAALMALGVGPGDAVITSPYSFFSTAGVVARLGARPVFADVESETYNVSAATVEAAIVEQCVVRKGELSVRAGGERVRVLMPVHLFGQMVEMNAVRDLARRYGLKIVEDAAQAVGAHDTNGTRVGDASDISCLSFFPSKNLGAFGDGGMCLTNDPTVAETLRVLRVHGSKAKYQHECVGGNFRLDAIQAAVLRVKLPHLDEWTRQRQDNASWYDARFAANDRITTPFARPGGRHVCNQYVVRVPERDSVKAQLQSARIETAIYYPIPLHLQGCFGYLGYGPGDLPESEAAARESIALPVFAGLTLEEMAYLADTLVASVKNLRRVEC